MQQRSTPKTRPLRQIARALAMATITFIGAVQQSAAQDIYPSRPVRIVVPFAPGGQGDVVTRMLAQRLAVRTGQPFVVENRPGAGGTTGAAAVARAAPDGYTLAFVSSGYAWLAALYSNLSFNPARDLTPVALLCSVPYVLLARKDAPFAGVSELVAQAKAKPGGITFASAGVGTLTHMLPAWFSAETGINLNHIPFGGAAPAMNSVLASQVDIYFDPLSSSVPQVRSGKVRALATTGATRAKAMPDTPTLAELGYQVRGSTWFGIMAPGAVPKAIIDKLNLEFNAVLEEDDVKQRLQAMDYSVDATSVAKFAAFLEAQTETWTRIVKANGIKAD